eukprot:scaffold3400_cov169-Amphora_coffeaeformis.AAC.8
MPSESKEIHKTSFAVGRSSSSSRIAFIAQEPSLGDWKESGAQHEERHDVEFEYHSDIYLHRVGERVALFICDQSMRDALQYQDIWDGRLLQ